MDEKIFELNSRIVEVKANLIRTDYLALKYAEGEITEGEYKPILEQRREWRAEINELEAEILALKNENTETTGN